MSTTLVLDTTFSVENHNFNIYMVLYISQNGEISPLPSNQKPLRGCNRTHCRILKWSKYTTLGNPAAKLCGKPLNIDVNNVEKDKKERDKNLPPHIQPFLRVSTKIFYILEGGGCFG